MINNPNIYRIANTLIVVAFMAVALFFVLTKADNYLRIKAVDECGKISKYEANLDKAKVTYPIVDVYKSCLKDKGY